MESFGLSKSLNISKKEAEELIEAYFSQFPKIKGFLDKIVNDATKTPLPKRYMEEKDILEN